MKTTDALIQIKEKQGIGTNALADRMGRNPRLISERIHQENISIGKLDEILRALDYKIVLVPRETREQEGWYRVE